MPLFRHSSVFPAAERVLKGLRANKTQLSTKRIGQSQKLLWNNFLHYSMKCEERDLSRQSYNFSRNQNVSKILMLNKTSEINYDLMKSMKNICVKVEFLHWAVGIESSRNIIIFSYWGHFTAITHARRLIKIKTTHMTYTYVIHTHTHKKSISRVNNELMCI